MAHNGHNSDAPPKFLSMLSKPDLEFSGLPRDEPHKQVGIIIKSQ